MIFKLSDEEEKAIRSLKRLEKIWPKSLFIYSASGTLCIMRKNEFGKQPSMGDGKGLDQKYVIATIKIENDGGDW